MKKTYKGSCHCGKVSYEVGLDLSIGTGRCNCSVCAKVRNWSATAKPDDFRLISGEEHLGDYRFTQASPNHHMFCRHCGVRTFTRGYVEQIGGHFVSVSLATIDNLSDRELAELTVRYMDGRNNDWFSTPAETRHL